MLNSPNDKLEGLSAGQRHKDATSAQIGGSRVDLGGVRLSEAGVDARLNASTAVRVTPEHIDSIIHQTVYHRLTDVLTVCVLTLQNGFTVTGESACVSPENYDQDLGEHFARKAAVDKVWPLEAYLLKQQQFVAESNNIVRDVVQHHVDMLFGTRSSSIDAQPCEVSDVAQEAMPGTSANDAIGGYGGPSEKEQAMYRRNRAIEHAHATYHERKDIEPADVLAAAKLYDAYVTGDDKPNNVELI